MAGPVVVDYGDGGNFGTGRSRGDLGVRMLSGIGARGRREAITRVNTSHEQGKAVRAKSPVKMSMGGFAFLNCLA